MNCKWNDNPCLLAGLMMELIYLCSDGVAPVERMAGNFGALLSGVWMGLAIVLMLVGLICLSPQGHKGVTRLRFWTKD